jgi:pimeloyl-ACP methyl ester carboxylesterase
MGQLSITQRFGNWVDSAGVKNAVIVTGLVAPSFYESSLTLNALRAVIVAGVALKIGSRAFETPAPISANSIIDNFAHPVCGTFERMLMDHGVSVYCQMPPPRFSSYEGLLIGITGANAGYTGMGEIPKLFTQRGWKAEVTVIPGFENKKMLRQLDAGTKLGRVVKMRQIIRHWNHTVGDNIAKRIIQEKTNHPQMPVHVVAHSLGGSLAMPAIMQLHPEIRKNVSLTLITPAFFPTFFYQAPWPFSWALREFLAPALVFKGGLRERPIPPFDPALGELIYASSRPYCSDGAVGLAGAYNRHKLEKVVPADQFPRIQLIVGGKDKTTVPGKTVAFAKKFFGNALLSVVGENSEATHFPHLEAGREEVQKAIEQFAGLV